MKAWYDKGYFNKCPFANTVMSRDSFVQGKSAVAFGHSQNIQDTLTKAKAAGYEPEVIPILSSTGHYPADPYTNNGVAIAANSRNVEKTLQFLDLIMEEPSYDYLAYLGVEGKHWVLKNGKIALPEGVTPDKTAYPWDAAGFWFLNKDIIKPFASWDDQYVALRGKLKSMLYNSTFTGFAFTPEKVKTEVSNINAVWAQYGSPLNVGITADADKSVDELAKKLKAAGIDKVQAEMKGQIVEFLASQKK